LRSSLYYELCVDCVCEITRVVVSIQPNDQILKTPPNCAVVFCLHPYFRDEKELDAPDADPDCALVPL